MGRREGVKTMAKVEDDLKNKLATKANNGGAVAAKSPEQTIYAYLKQMEPEIKRALPKHMDVDRLSRIAFTTIRTTPQLLACNMASLLGAVMQAAQLGLEPGLLGHCYLVPFRNNKENRMDVQFIIGYKGMIDLARRSGNILSISAHEVYENDSFRLQYGLDEELTHIPWHVREDKNYTEPGPIRGAYMIAKLKDGGHQIHYMSKHEIDEHRKRSKASGSGPWVTDYVEMCKKTVVRSAWKWLPISVELSKPMVANDETVKAELAEDMSDVIDITAMVQELPAEQPAEGAAE